VYSNLSAKMRTIDMERMNETTATTIAGWSSRSSIGRLHRPRTAADGEGRPGGTTPTTGSCSLGSWASHEMRVASTRRMSCSGSVTALQKRLLNFWIPTSTRTPPIPVSSAAICTPPPPPPSLL
jgi:hypothetical protein